MAFQTSSGSPRERWITALLPALVIVAIYIGLVNLGSGREITKLRSELKSAQEQAVTPDVLFGLHSQQIAADKELDALNQEVAQLRRSIETSVARFGAGSANAQMVRVGQLCRELSISLLAQKPAESVKVSRVRESSLQTLRKLLPAESIGYRQFDLVGKFADMQALLRRLPEEADGVAPLAIELLRTQAEEPGQRQVGERHWRLYLLMSAEG